MSVFCTPDGRPFFGGTYYPPVDRGGYPGVPAGDRRARRTPGRPSATWSSARPRSCSAAVDQQVTLADSLASTLDAPRAAASPSSSTPLVAHLKRTFDEEWGGFGLGAQVPPPHADRAVPPPPRRHRRSRVARPWPPAPSTRWRPVASTTTWPGASPATRPTGEWLVPHFEKMLTDQALLARAYLHAWQVTGRDDYRQVMTETLDSVLGDLATPSGWPRLLRRRRRGRERGRARHLHPGRARRRARGRGRSGLGR